MAASSPNHEDVKELVAMYALGNLTAAEARTLKEHLETCAECRTELASFRPVVDLLAQSAPQHRPPLDLRARVLAVATSPDAGRSAITTRTTGRSSVAPWLLAAASLIAAVGLGVYAMQLRTRIDTLDAEVRAAAERTVRIEQQLAEVRTNAERAQLIANVVGAPDVVHVRLAGQAPTPTASALAMWSRPNGLVFTAKNLPQPAVGRTYQLWVLTADPAYATISAGTARPDANGNLEIALVTPPTIPPPTAIAVTEENEGGVDSPTTKPLLAGAVGL